MKFLETWNQRLGLWTEERFYLALLAAMTLVLASVVTIFDLDLQRHFMMIACDTAFFQNVLANNLNGHWFRETAFGGPNMFGQHATLILVLLTPIYALAPSPDTLFILQVFGVYSSIIPFYLVAADLLRRPSFAFLLAMAILPTPLLFHMALAPFHPETWMLTGVLWAYFFYRRNHVAGFWTALALSLGCGEHVALIFIALGLSLCLFDDGLPWRKRYGVWALAGGLGWLLMAVLVLYPLMHAPQTGDLYADNYANWGVKSVSGLPLAVAADPMKAAGLLLLPVRWGHLLELVGVPLILALLSWRSIVLLAPIPFYFLMGDQEFFLYFHAYYYQFALFAGCIGLLFFCARWDVSSRLGIVTLAAVAFLNLLILFPVIVFYGAYTPGQDVALDAALHEAFEKIPVDAAVYSPHRYSAYLSNHPNMVMGDVSDPGLNFDAMIESKYPTTNVHAAQIDYIVADVVNDQCGWRQGKYDPATSQQRAANVNQLLKTGQWAVDFNNSGVVILRRIGK